MFKKIAMTAVAASTIAMSMQASANNNHHRHNAAIDKEQREQAVMIQQGVKTCQITPAEAKQAYSTHQRIARMESKFKANGLSRWERQTLNEKLHAARVEINQLTKNRTTCRTKKHSNYRDHSGSKGHRNGSNNYRYNSNTQSKGSISISVRNVF